MGLFKSPYVTIVPLTPVTTGKLCISALILHFAVESKINMLNCHLNLSFSFKYFTKVSS